jgi:hypothetical protein
LCTKNYTCFWYGKRLEETREHGVRFAIKKSLLAMIKTSEGGWNRKNPTSASSHKRRACEPNLHSSMENKDECYVQLQTVIHGFPSNEKQLLVDISRRINKERDSWHNCLYQFATGSLNEKE